MSYCALFSLAGRLLAVPLFSLAATSCSVVERVGVGLLYQKSPLPAGSIRRDVAYGPDARHRLDLFLPAGPAGWPTAVFVHGGSWTEGDKALEVGGADVYGNIGRYLAGQGIGAAVINYRLQPGATWQEQIGDVGQAVAWAHRNIADHGGNPGRFFLFGHSAGAELAAYAALDPRVLAAAGVPASALRGVIAVSGAGLDLTDPKTYALGHSPDYYRGIFDPAKTNPRWQQTASAVHYIRSNSPPFLVMVGGAEEPAMIRQSVRLHEALQARGVPSTLLKIPWQSHGRMVLTLSRQDQRSGPAVVEFIRENGAKRPPARKKLAGTARPGAA